MNLKNSKFFKRIQKLRRISRDKLRKEKLKLIECRLGKAFHEKSALTDLQNGTALEEANTTENFSNIQIAKARSKNSLTFQGKKFLNHQNGNCSKKCIRSDNVNGLVQLDNKCYKVECIVDANESRRFNTESIFLNSSTRYSICVCNSHYNLIGRIAKSMGFKLVKANQLWNILWTDSIPGVEICKTMKRFQQINHFPGMMEICRKDLLSRNLNRMLKLYPKDYKIFPKTWIFPADYGEAVKYANSCNKQKMFIIKPDSGAQGRGIRLTNDLKNISPTERMICQTYIRKPLLIDGYKFDLRVYALITCVDPLRIFVYNEGLVRLATNKYVEPSMINSKDLYMHLTNYSVNKKSSQYEICDNDDCGSKRNFSAINNWMRYQNYNVKEFWSNIDDIVVKTILSAWPILKHNYHASFPAHDIIQACFEILGFDILVDSKMKPYILEVNHSPSFHANEVVDHQVKIPLIQDTLSMIGTILVDKRQILCEDRKRVKQRLLKFKVKNLYQKSNLTKVYPPSQQESSHTTIECQVNALARQIAWEESHLGDYRRIMPPNDPLKLKYYCQFYGQENQSSIFAKTAATKTREEVAKKLRQELQEKRIKQTEMLRRNLTTDNFEKRQRKRTTLSRISVEKQRLELLRAKAPWSPGFISAAEERLRYTDMKMRDDILKELQITETIYDFFYSTGNLTKTDIAKFPHFYRSLEGGIII